MRDAESPFAESSRSAVLAGTCMVVGACLLLLGLLGACRAHATVIHKLTSTFPTSELSVPTSTAYDEASDSVYVMDLFSGTIAKYSSTGTPQNFSALGTNTINPGCADKCGQIAVDNSGGPNQGVIYIGNEINSETTSRRLYAYLPTGRETEGINAQSSINTQMRFCGVATDPQEHVYIGHNTGLNNFELSPVPDGPAHINRFKPGLWLPSEVSPEPQKWPITGTMYSMPYDSLSSGRSNTCRIGASSDGDQYFSAYTTGIEGVLERAPVVRASNAAFDVLPGPAITTVDEGSTDFRVDPATDDVYFVHGNEGETTIIRRNDAGKKLETLGGLLFSAGVAIDGDTGTVYASDGFEGNVKVYTTTIGPDISYGQPTIGATSATVSATVGTAGAGNVTDCKVEYGANDTYGTTKQCTPDASGTPFTGDTPITASFTGLNKETTYHYRVTATNANGTTEGPDQTLSTRNVVGLSTDAPTEITKSTATLNGSWVGDGSPTSYVFEWGEDDEYGETTPTGGPSSEAGPVQVSEPIAGLVPDTADQHGEYHYRIVATNAEGTSYGEDLLFLTDPPDPPQVTETVATGVSATGATLSAMVNPNMGKTFFQFEYGTTAGYGSHTPASSSIGQGETFQPVSEPLAGLNPGTTYHFRTVATNFGGTTFGSDQVFTTTAGPSPPTPAATVAAPASSSTPAPAAQPEQTTTRTKRCRKNQVKRHGKCVKRKSKKKHKAHKRRSNGHG